MLLYPSVDDLLKKLTQDIHLLCWQASGHMSLMLVLPHYFQATNRPKLLVVHLKKLQPELYR